MMAARSLQAEAVLSTGRARLVIASFGSERLVRPFVVSMRRCRYQAAARSDGLPTHQGCLDPLMGPLDRSVS